MNRERVERDSDGNITKMYRYNAKGELTLLRSMAGLCSCLYLLRI